MLPAWTASADAACPAAQAALPARAAPAPARRRRIKARRPTRHDLRTPSPPTRKARPEGSVSLFDISFPAADQRQGPLDRLWRFSSRAPKSDSPSKMIIIKEGHRRGGAGGYIHAGSLRRREARSSGRADQDGGDPRRLPGASQQPSSRARRNSSEISLAFGRRRLCNRKRMLADCRSQLALRKRSPFRRITPGRAGAGTARTGPLRLFGGRGCRSSPRRRRPSRTTRAFSRPPGAAPCGPPPSCKHFTHPLPKRPRRD